MEIEELRAELGKSARKRLDRLTWELFQNEFVDELSPRPLPEPTRWQRLASMPRIAKRRIANAWNCLRYGADFDDY